MDIGWKFKGYDLRIRFFRLHISSGFDLKLRFVFLSSFFDVDK